MPSREQLNLRAYSNGFDPSTIPNDSKLEQKILWLEKNTYAVTGTLPTTTFTLSGAAGNTETFTVGATTYTMKTALTGVIASGTITSTGTIPNDGDTVFIGNTHYVFKTTLSTGAALALVQGGSTNKFEVLINASAANALTNLKAAINASGTPGTDYSTNLTVANQNAQATTKTATTLLVTRFLAGTDAYLGSLVQTTVVNNGTATLSWGATSLTGGVNPAANEILIGAAATNSLDNMKDAINGTVVSGARDVTVSSNTLRHQFVTAGTKTASTLVIASTDTNNSGALATTETFANGAFTGSTLASGVAGQIAIASGTTVGVNETISGASGAKNTSL